ALVKRSADVALMGPPPPPKRIKRPSTVLDEDTYTKALSHIIARDFFPGLQETEAQQEYLDALESKDGAWIAEAGQTLTQAMTPGPDGRRYRGRRGTSMAPMMAAAHATPRDWTADTPRTVAESVEEPEKAQHVDLSLSLSAFQAKYTSEDNESFNALLDKQNNKRAENYAWAWNENKILAPRQIAYRERQAKLEASRAESQLQVYEDTRPAMPEHKVSAPRNALMFIPDSIEDSQVTVSQAAEARSNAPPKAVLHDNTRMPIAAPVEPPIPPSPSMSAIDAAIAGRPRPTHSEAGYIGSETPRVAGYAFVDAEPTSAELAAKHGYDPSSLLSQIAADASPSPFKINEVSTREALHHRLVDKHKQSTRPVEDARSPIPRFLSGAKKKPGSLTPAAQRLLGEIG
ncbi:hypothetical protein EJ06DRAFT_454340, partial [Trichodelitschia bisporula]